MNRYMVITTIKPLVVPLDSDTTFPVVHRIVGDSAWESVNGYCKYLSKYPNHNWMNDRKPSPLLPVAGLEFQTEHMAASPTSAGVAALAWITTHSSTWGIPGTWASAGQSVYTMIGNIIGEPTIDWSAGIVSL